MKPIIGATRGTDVDRTCDSERMIYFRNLLKHGEYQRMPQAAAA